MLLTKFLSTVFLVLLTFAQQIGPSSTSINPQNISNNIVKMQKQKIKSNLRNQSNEKDLQSNFKPIKDQKKVNAVGIPYRTSKRASLQETFKTANQFYCGKPYLSLQKLNLNKIQKNRQKLVSTKYGFNMYVDSVDTIISKAIENSGTWQPQFINLIGHIIRPGYKVLNLGAQLGLQALVMGKIIGETGKLFIFQPYSFSNKLLNKSLQLNNLTNITTLYKLGASDQKTTALIQINYGNTGMAQITSTSSKKKSSSIPYHIDQQEQVNIDRVDTVLPQDITLDFALIDVQKMQVKALNGMKNIIKRSKNLVMMVQWQYLNNKKRDEQSTYELLTFLKELNYKVYRYSGGDVNTCTVGKFNEILDIYQLLHISFSDIFFIPKDYVLPF